MAEDSRFAGSGGVLVSAVFVLQQREGRRDRER